MIERGQRLKKKNVSGVGGGGRREKRFSVLSHTKHLSLWEGVSMNL